MSDDYGIGRFPQHAALLRDSAISPEMARTRGYVSVDTKARLTSLGFSPAQASVPGLLIPLRDKAGKCTGFQYRPDEPRQRNGKPIKYETPPGQQNRVDVPPGVGDALGDPAVDLWITEGVRKADAATELGLTCVSLSGVWNWRGSNDKGGKVALPDWDDIALNGRRVVLAFDSDSRSNPSVGKALDALAAYLSSKGATVLVCSLPDGADGKTGLDDYIAAGHDRDDLEQLVEQKTTPARPAPKESVATALVHLALDGYRIGISTDDEPFALPLTGARVVRPLRGGKNSLRAALADRYYTTTGAVAPQQALTEALLTLEGRAAQQQADRLHLRVAEHGGTIFLDLGDSTGRAAALTATGWRVVDQPPVLFRRTQLTAALPEPAAGGSLDDLWSLLNVAPRDRPVVLAWLVAALLPDVPHPVLALRGEQGSGKSTVTRILAALLDPSPAQVRKPPRDVDGWVTAASGSWVVGVDNVSTVSEWWSDALCRAVTGDGDVRRTLYSNADLTVFSFRRVVLLNGIDLGAVRDDLAERLLTVELDRIVETGRRLDADLACRWKEAHPRLLGALLGLACQVLAVLPGMQLDRLPRMADFARVLAAVDEVLGTAGLSTYTAQAGDLAADAVSGDQVLASITTAITAPWTGTASELLRLLDHDTDIRRSKDWPKDARALTALLRRRAPSLRRLGWVVEDLGRGGKGMVIRFRIEPPDRQAPKQATASEAGDSGGPAGTGDAHRLPPDGPLTWGNAGTSAEAGDAGDRNGPSLAWVVEQVGGELVEPDARPSIREGAGTSPASPASPAEVGPCVVCTAPTRRYGSAGSPFCPACTVRQRAAS